MTHLGWIILITLALKYSIMFVHCPTVVNRDKERTRDQTQWNAPRPISNPATRKYHVPTYLPHALYYGQGSTLFFSIKHKLRATCLLTVHLS